MAIEAVGSFESWAELYQTTRHHSTEYWCLRSDQRDNLQSDMSNTSFTFTVIKSKVFGRGKRRILKGGFLVLQKRIIILTSLVTVRFRKISLFLEINSIF